MNTNQDFEQLKLLAIFHYVLAGLIAVFSMFPLIHLAMGIAMVTGLFDDSIEGDLPPRILGWFLIIIPVFIILFGLTLSVIVAIAGKRLKAYSGYSFCFVVAAIECCFMPFGTVLGVFTIIVLARPSVKALFGVPLK